MIFFRRYYLQSIAHLSTEYQLDVSEIRKTGQNFFNERADFVCGHLIPLASRLGQRGPNMFLSMRKCRETQGVQSFGANSVVSAAKHA